MPTDAELDVLHILWDHGPSTVRFVHEKLNTSRKTGYTTTLKIMQIMRSKGIVTCNDTSRTHIYEANLVRNEVEKRLVNKLLGSVFSGSASRLVMQALGTHRPSRVELEEIKKLITELEQENKGK